MIKQTTSYLRLISLFIAYLCLTGCSSRRQDTDSEPQLRQIREELLKLNERLDSLIGNVSEAKAGLAKLQERVLAAQAQELAQVEQDCNEFRDSLPPLLGIEIAEELAALNWSLETRKLLAKPPSVDELLDIESLRDAIPPTLEEQTAKSLLSQLVEKTRQSAHELAQAEQTTSEDLQLVLGTLERFPGPDEPAPSWLGELKQQLTSRIDTIRQTEQKSSLEEQAKDIGKQIQVVSEITAPDVRLAVLGALNETLDRIRIQCALEKSMDSWTPFAELQRQAESEITASLESLASQNAVKLSKARMSYQTWAMSQIEKMKSFLYDEELEKELYRLRDESAQAQSPVIVRWADFINVRKQIESGIGSLAKDFKLTAEQKTKIGPFVKANWYPLLYQVKHDAAMRHLLPIDQHLLEPPVAKFYTDVFEKVWEQLGKHDGMQLSLAKMTASVAKRSLDAEMKGVQ
jgi:hypothetical protein